MSDHIPLISSGQTRDLPGSWRLRWRWFPFVLRVVGLILLLIALSRPTSQERLPQRTLGIDIMLCLDVSSSMAAKDMDPQHSRLQIAKDAATDFLQKRDGDRIALLQFARYADLLSPRTQHYDALRTLIGGIKMVEADGLEDRTGIGGAVARAAQVLGRSDAKSKVLILLTDGEENLAQDSASEEISLAEAAKLCSHFGVRVHLISSRPGALSNGAELLASTTGGRFFTATDAAAVGQVYDLIDALEKSELEEPRYRWKEQFFPFLMVGLLALLLARLLAETKLEVLP
jgi:Ca-activated chloride channel homolog